LKLLLRKKDGDRRWNLLQEANGTKIKIRYIKNELYEGNNI